MNFMKSVFDSPIVYRTGLALVHFLWQGALVALLLGAALTILRRRTAAARYIACITALLLLAACPIATFFLTPARAATPPVPSAQLSPKPAPIPPLSAPIVHGNHQPAAIPIMAASHPGKVAPAKLQLAPPPAPHPSIAPSPTLSEKLLTLLPRVLPWLVLAWTLGALILSIYNLGGYVAVRRLRLLATTPAPAHVTASASRLARSMNITRAIRLLQSSLIDSPMVIGALKPIILLPASLLTTLSAAQIESLLAHELAHIRRHDYLINLFQAVIETLLFYHPSIWWVSRRIRIERELCCDDQAIATTQNRTAYIQALAAIAEENRKGRELPLTPHTQSLSANGLKMKEAGAFALAANSTALLPRLRRLLGLPDADAARSPRSLAGALALVLCLLATAAVITRAADRPAAPKDKDFDIPKTWILELEVVDKTLGEPIPKIPINVSIDNRRFSYVTDDQGHAHIEYPEGLKYLVITPKAPAFVPINLSWRNFNSKDPVPDAYKLELEQGSTIGGIVNDEAGNPIPNVIVQLSVPYRHGEEQSREQLDLYNLPIKTDATGHWRCDVVPKDMAQPYVRLSHPDFLSDEMFGETPVPPLPKLRDLTGVMVMKKGLSVSGKVLDDQGQPIAGAKVYQGGDRFGSNYPETKTDAAGNFRFPHCRPGNELVLTVTAKGKSPDQKSLMFDKPLDNVEFRLEPGHVVKGRVIDAAGNPIPKVMIATDTWRDHRALMVRFDTDANGAFLWNEAPADEVLTDFLKQGYMDNRRVHIKPSDQDIVITLRKPVRVTGTVVDADTNQPITSFKVVQGIQWENQPEISWQPSDPQIHPKDGKFEFELTNPYPGYAVRIDTPDHLPETSRVFKDNQGDISLEFKLKKGKILAGTLRTPDGKPLANTDVVLCTGTNGPYITNGEITQRDQHTIVKTNDAGHYQLPPQTGNFSIVVVDEKGYAELRSDELAKSSDITVQPWGKVEGTLKIGTKAGARQTINVSHQESPGEHSQQPRVYHDLRASTDDNGHFSVGHVPPGRTYVALQVQFSQYTYGYTQGRNVEVKPGETAHIDLGGAGRPVIGKLTVPDELKGKIAANNDNTFMMTKIENLPDFRPANWDKLDEPARKKFIADYLKSPKYLVYQKQLENRLQFSIKVQSDGTFRAEDIPAGTYQFTAIAAAPSNKGAFGGQPLATVNTDIIVPEMPGGRSDDPLDIGTIAYKPVKP